MKYHIFTWLILISISCSTMAVTVDIHTKTGITSFEVESASTTETRSKGLMFRRTMPERGGMLFQYPEPSIVYMWMKDTYIPLDILFVDASGDIVHIAQSTVPHDRTPLGSDIPVINAIELHAGVVEKYNIALGDKVVITVTDNKNKHHETLSLP